MTSNLRDRMASEIGRLEPLEDLTADTIAKGRARLRRRNAGVAMMVAATVVAATSWAFLGLGAGGDSSVTVADRSQALEAPLASDVAPREEWAQQLAQVFAAHLPTGFAAGVDQSGDDEGRGVPEFLASGPRGQVQLNATVYLGARLPTPTCAKSKALQCRVLSTGSGTATVLKDVHSADDLPRASQIWINEGKVQTIVNLVEANPGVSQYRIDDLAGLATARGLGEAIDFAVAHADELRDYAVTQP